MSEIRQSPMRPWPIWSLAGGLATIGMALALVLRRDVAPLTANPAHIGLLIGLFLVVEFLRFDVAFGQHSHSFTMSELALVVALLTGRPADVILAQTVAMALFFGFYRRVPLIRLAFNVGQVAGTTAIGALVFHTIVDATGELERGRTALAAVSAGLVVAILQAIAVTIVIRLSGRRIERREVVRNMIFAAGTALSGAAVGVQAVFLARRSLALVPVVAIPLLLAFAAYKAYVSLQRLSERTEFLQQATNALHETQNLDEGLLALLQQTRSAMRAAASRIVLFTPDGVVTVEARDGDEHSTPMTVARVDVAAAARALMSGLQGAAFVDTRRQELAALELADGIAAPLFRNQERAGILLVSNRQGNLDAFHDSDLDLLTLVGGQINVALERGWLQQSLRQLLDLESRLAHQAYHDGLTGLANRRLFNERLERVVGGNDRHPAALLLIDLDDFKEVNDTYGHVVGDELLVELGARLRRIAGRSDLVARVGGDEFAFVLEGVDDHVTALKRATEVIAAISLPVSLRDRELVMSGSVGISLSTDNAATTEEFHRNADLALYQAKQEGKNRVATYDPSMNEAAEERRRLIAAMSSAVPNNELRVVFQPIFDLVTGELLGSEALMRWRHPVRGDLGPAQFLGVAEQTGLIASMGVWLLHGALRATARWAQMLGPDRRFTMNVNLSARQLLDVGLVDIVRSALIETGVSPDRLVLEITESALIEDMDRTRDVVVGLVALGVKVSLDDFGTGYSSFTHVRTFPLHQIKIDGSFVKTIDSNATSAALVGSIVHLANALGLEAVAEGIETEDQLAELRRVGCRLGQGYLMSPPLSESEFQSRIEGDRALASQWG
jgi:diguanylate cyclase (GGDEF)-like protein